MNAIDIYIKSLFSSFEDNYLFYVCQWRHGSRIENWLTGIGGK